MKREVLDAVAAATQREQLLLALAGRHAAGVPDLPDKTTAIRDAVATLTAQGAPYALIGGVAVGIRSGVPRATLDVNFAVASTIDRKWLGDRLVEAGFVLRGSFPHSMNFVHRSGEPVQLAFDAGFDPMIARAETLVLGDLSIVVVTKDDLITMKRRAAADPTRRRSKALRDEADIALLEGDVPDPGEGW
jgi:hypothetical protein